MSSSKKATKDHIDIYADAMDNYNKICEAERFNLMIDVASEKVMLTRSINTVEIVVERKDGIMTTKFNLVPTKSLVHDLLKVIYDHKAKTAAHLNRVAQLKDSIKTSIADIETSEKLKKQVEYSKGATALKQLNSEVLGGAHEG